MVSESGKGISPNCWTSEKRQYALINFASPILTSRVDAYDPTFSIVSALEIRVFARFIAL